MKNWCNIFKYGLKNHCPQPGTTMCTVNEVEEGNKNKGKCAQSSNFGCDLYWLHPAPICRTCFTFAHFVLLLFMLMPADNPNFVQNEFRNEVSKHIGFRGELL